MNSEVRMSVSSMISDEEMEIIMIRTTIFDKKFENCSYSEDDSEKTEERVELTEGAIQ